MEQAIVTKAVDGDQPFMHALVVEDSRAHRMVLRSYMHELGYEVTEATDGCEGLEQLKRFKEFDVVLVNWEMPVMDGVEFIRRVRADSAFSGLPIIMVSSISNGDAILQALQAGADEYLMKPINKQALAAKLELLGIEHR